MNDVMLKKQNPEKTLFKLQKKHYILFGIFLSLCFTLSMLIPITGDDYWWHVKIGEWIVQNKQIPMTGIYSWYGKDLSWFAHEWLAEVILYELGCLFTPEIGGLLIFLS